MTFGFGKSHYWGLGIIFAPKSAEYPANFVINFLCFEVLISWGINKNKEEHINELNEQIEEIFKNA